MSESNSLSRSGQTLMMAPFEQAIRNALGRMDAQGFDSRFWNKDARLWRREEGDPSVVGAMGWLHVAETMRERIAELQTFKHEIAEAGFERVILAGMGGSSLAPLVLGELFGRSTQGLPLSVLDSTDPETVLRIEREGPLEKCLFIISSKSGSTAEPNAFDDYFFDRLGKTVSSPGNNFVAITDPGTQMEQIAKERKFRRVFLNFADIGGRFSALSYFGMVPAALLGIDLERLLDRAIQVVTDTTAEGTAASKPALVLGAAIGELALQGKDKLTFILPKAWESLGLWLEQLVAESTGKEGKGVLPVAGEEAGTPSEYGDDRIFAYLRPNDEDCTFLDARLATLRDADRPVVEVELRDPYDVATEFMRWEIATAVAGSIIGINPFDQPNVQEAKDVTKRLLKQVEEEGSLAQPKPDAAFEGLEVYGEVKGDDLEEAFCGYLAQAHSGDFFTLMAYVTESTEMTSALTKLQQHIRDATKCATTKGYGPRFLHSTGQFHKGGPNKGHFIQLTKNDSEDAPLPGRSYNFGTFRNAQAQGDKETLEAHGRSVIRIHLGSQPVQGVLKLLKAVEARPRVVHA